MTQSSKLLLKFWERSMTMLEQQNNRHPLELGPLSTTFLLKDIVRAQAEQYLKTLEAN